MAYQRTQVNVACIQQFSSHSWSVITFLQHAPFDRFGKEIKVQQTAALHTYTVTLAKSKDGLYLVVCHTSLYLDYVLIKF